MVEIRTPGWDMGIFHGRLFHPLFSTWSPTPVLSSSRGPELLILASAGSFFWSGSVSLKKLKNPSWAPAHLCGASKQGEAIYGLPGPVGAHMLKIWPYGGDSYPWLGNGYFSWATFSPTFFHLVTHASTIQLPRS